MRFAFGDFVLDGGRFELLRAGGRVAVQPKVLRLLLHLAQHRDRVVPHAELLAALWPDEVVSSGSVKRAVKSARRVLDERADSPITIRSVRGAGYQPGQPNFVAIQGWNAAGVYQQAIAIIGKRIDG